MSYLVLARKWRPQTFEELVGQEPIATTLQNAIRAGRVAHAFLFTGVRGVGKTTAARILAKALNCENGPTPTPCNECTHCTEITAGSAVDVLEIDGASNTGVDDVREIIENVRYRPAACRFKIYIIDEVHMLSTSAFNALLKTLEEPPAHVKFIFATTDPHKVPHTIHSRCQRYDFKRIPYQQIVDRLAAIAAADGIRAGERALFLLARESEGSMRDAQSLFDQVIAFAGAEVSDEAVTAALGLADHERVFVLAEALARRDPSGALDALNQLYEFGYDLRRLTRDLLEFFRHLSVAKLLPDGALLADLPAEDRTRLHECARDIPHEELDRAFRVLLQTESEIARVPYPKLVLDMAVIKLATFAPLLSGDELLRRLDGVSTGSAPPPAGGSSGGGQRRPSDPPASRPSLARDSAPAADAPASAGAGRGPVSWGGFLTFVGREKITLKPYLDEVKVPASLDADVVPLAIAPGFFHDYLLRPESLAAVEELAARYFGRPLRFSVSALTEAAAAAQRPPTAAEMRARALEDPTVRAAVDVLGGQLQEVRPRRTRRGG